ncbi:cytochrome P450 [Bradyrhizobium sp. HKCCYLRH2015]|uniref:cytochrome P450 n=2 Tax=Bradyrhizobium TaxID=374 RepID=UPI003EBBC085
MLKSKYYAAIEQAQAEDPQEDGLRFPPFNLDEIGADSWRHRFKVWLIGAMLPPALFLLRTFWPVARIGSFVIVTRAEDVRKVLTQPEMFEVPFGPEMTKLAGGENFVLGLEGEPHAKQREIIKSVLDTKDEVLRVAVRREDAELVARLSNRFAKALIRSSAGRIDVMKDYITRIATETCIEYFGLKVEDPDAFAEWAMSISALLFADPTGDRATRRLALNGAARIRLVIANSIADIKAKSASADTSDTILGRLILLQRKDPAAVTDEKICAVLVGLITGFIPTNTLAAGKILQELLRRPFAMQDAMQRARAARKADEQDEQRIGKLKHPERHALRAILLEAARLNPALAPGQWRYAKEKSKVGKGVFRRSVPAGATVVVSTMSALRDGREIKSPGWFNPDRPAPSSDLLFGTGIHECLGKYLAIEQITELFMVLLSQDNLRRRKTNWGWWGGIKWVGPFPRWLDMDFAPALAPGTQTMVTICAPLADGAYREAIEAKIGTLGNPAEGNLRKQLDETNIVHFASLALIEAGDAASPCPMLLLEMNVDGSLEAAIASVAAADIAAGGSLTAIFENTPLGKVPLETVLNRYKRDLQTRPWGTIGLNFAGTSEFSVADIDMQDKLAAFARAALDSSMAFHARYGSLAMQALTYVRDFVRRPADMSERATNFRNPEGWGGREAEFADYLIVPSRNRLKISDWTPRTKGDAVFAFIRSPTFFCFAVVLAVVDLLLSVAISRAVGPTWLGLPGRLLLATTGGIAGTALLVGIVAAGFVALLHYHDLHDVPDDKDPPLQAVRKVARVEDPPGFAHNHFMAVTELKRGWFRRLTLALSLWVIKQMVLHWFRPGFVLNMGTIHYAKWFRLPGQEKLIFQANYDGSWESYLEDFIMKAHQGQTAAWSNGVGFPRTKFLIYGGAQDGDRFKRWVRRQQVLAPFWYSRFPKLTTDQIRNNALIRDGLARAMTEEKARAWLDCFGSIPRPDYSIESNEVQSLVFSAQRHLYCVNYALIRLPDDDEDGRNARADWLESLVPELIDDAPASCAITFGDHMFPANVEKTRSAAFVAFTAQGLAKLGLSGPDKQDGLATFSAAFNMGMANRGRGLGDDEVSPSLRWHWRDAEIDGQGTGDGGAGKAADAILLIYGKDRKQCDDILDCHLDSLGDRSRVLLHTIVTEPLTERIVYRDGSAALEVVKGDDSDDYKGHDVPGHSPTEFEKSEAQKKRDLLKFEHFGFRDGISQPVIRGTKRFLNRPPARDVLEPGEFILGYRNNQGYYPPTASVRAESDPGKRLPVVLQEIPSRFPSFEGANTAARDFGRNGSFLVIRQLEQDVEGFKKFLDAKVLQVQDDYPNLDEATGTPVTAEWIAAKMMGRWPNGTPLVERPEASKGPFGAKSKEMSYNDFNYGIDDPQGLSCPFGAHIRRANPRDSMQPDDPSQQAITNRHRLLRRGRTYTYRPKPTDDKVEKGLLFTCLCADLDRQFEFVQQTWVGSPSFHGLRNEPDPLVAWHSKESSFTIPTVSGPVRLGDMQNFVTVRAGGYFFLPSRSALRHLADLAGAKRGHSAVAVSGEAAISDSCNTDRANTATNQDATVNGL